MAPSPPAPQPTAIVTNKIATKTIITTKDIGSVVAAASAGYQTKATNLSFDQLIEPVSRCVLLVLLLVVSTGPLIRQLLVTTLLDLAALIVGSLWLLGDILPCLALALVFHDAILARPSPLLMFARNNREGKPTKSPDSKFLNAIIVIFVLLYLCDFIIFLTGNGRLLENYRYAFFHIQIWLSMAYLLKPWRWTGVDTRELIQIFDHFYQMLLEAIQALIEFLKMRPQLIAAKVPQVAPVVSRAESSGQSIKEPEVEETTTRVVNSVSSDPLPPLLEPAVASTSGTNGNSTKKSTKKKKKTTTKNATRGANLSSNIRVNTSGRSGGRRAAKATTQQTIIMRGRTCKGTSTTTRSRRRTSAGARHRCNSTCDCSGRTVNLNLNMS